MTISDKIRIYELSRDLNLENKDILDAAQKLSISVKSHSSSISSEDAKKIKSLINEKNSNKKILSVNKSPIKKDNYQEIEQMVERILRNEEERKRIIEQVKTGKLLKFFKENVKFKSKKLSYDSFIKIAYPTTQ